MKSLLIEDNPADARLIREMLKEDTGEPFEFEQVNRLETALARLRAETFDVVLLDLGLPDSCGMETLQRAKKANGNLAIIVLTGVNDAAFAADAVRAGAQDYLIKGRFDSEVLLRVMRYAIERKRAGEEIQSLNDELQKTSRAVEQSADHVVITNLAGVIEYANPAVLEYTGYKREEVVGQNPRIFKSGHQDAAFYRELWRTILSGQSFRGEFHNRRKDGQLYCEEKTISPLRDAHGRITHFVATGKEITKRKLAEEASHESELRLADAQKIAHLGSAVVELQSGTAHWSDEHFRIWGLEPGQAPASLELFINAIHPDDRERVACLSKAQIPFDTEFRVVRSDGEVRIVHCRTRIDRNAEGAPVRLVGTALDITARKQAEQLLQKTTDALHRLLEHSPVVIYTLKVEGERIIPAVVSENITRLLGFKIPEALTYEWWVRQLHPEDRERAIASISETLTQGASITEYRLCHKNGTYRWLEDRRSLIFDPASQTKEITGVWTDITERREAQDALRESERRFSDMLGKIELVSVMLNAKAEIIYCNDYLLRLTGWERGDVLGRDWFEFFLPLELADELHTLHASLLADQPPAWHHENEIRTRTGERRLIRWSNSVLRSPSGQVIGTASIGEDITERKRNERLALRSQRLEAIGTLAGGVAHDLNNALAPIIMGTEILRTEFPGNSELIDIFQSSAKRGTDMVRQLLSFAKGATGETVLLQPLHLIKEIGSLMKGSFPKNIEVEIKCEKQLPVVRGDATQLHQVLLNLCVNARDAMPNGGVLTVEANRLRVDASYAHSIHDAKPGDYVVFRVRDTGTGIPPEILDRVFDPFFTTKGPEHGTGLGLSTVMGIVKGHGGFLHVYSKVGAGSTFVVHLPVAQSSGASELAPAMEVQYRGQEEMILFVDDEEAIRNVARIVLRRLNFKPLMAISGADGLIQAAEHRTELRAVVADLHMPQMDGLRFIRSLRRMLPSVPIALASGRMDDATAEQCQKLGVLTVLEKPFTQGQFSNALEKLLAAK